MPQKKETSAEEEALQNALLPIVNRLIDKNFENADDKIAAKITPLIGGAIREQIKNQKDDIVDALYPVMGNMISKFVAKSFEDLLNKINDKIQNGLSTEAVKRKIKAKLKGISESELLLQESSSAKIKAALLIHKESGSLLCKVEDENATLSDADMLASMMSAIRSFVNEWINNNESYKELGEIEYGGNKIIIEASGHSYLAVIVEGATSKKTYEDIRHVLEEIVSKYAQELRDFNGSYENFPKEEIQNSLKNLFLKTPPEATPQSKKSPLLWIIPILLIAYLAYLFYNEYIDDQYEKHITSMIEQTSVLAPFRINVDVEDKVATISGKLPFAYHKQRVDELLRKVDGLKAIHDKIIILPTLTDPMQVSANIAYLIKGINLNKQNNINYIFDYNTLTLKGYIADKKTKVEFLRALQTIQGIQKINDQISIQTPEFCANLYFKTASTKLDDASHQKLSELVNIIKEHHAKESIKIQAFSDMIGDTQHNRELAQSRVKNIKKSLQETYHLTNSITTEIFNTPPVGIDPKTEPQKARCIKISLQGNKSNV